MAVTGGLRKDTHITRPKALQPFGLASLIQMGMQAKEYPMAYPELYIPIEPVINTLFWLGGATANCQHFGRPFFMSKSPLKMPQADHHSTNNQNCNLCPVLGASPAFPFAGECKRMSEHFSHRARLLGHFAMNATVQSNSNHAAHFGTPVKIRLTNALPNIGLRVTGAGICVGVGVRYHLAHTR